MLRLSGETDDGHILLYSRCAIRAYTVRAYYWPFKRLVPKSY